MEKYLISLVCVIAVSMFAYGEGADVQEIAEQAERHKYTIDYLNFGGIYPSDKWNENFPELTPSARDEMCKKAKDTALLDSDNPVADEKLYYTYIQKSPNSAPRVALIKCLTVPVSYLRTEAPYKQIVILLAKNKFVEDKTSYNFKAETVQFSPIPCAEFVSRLPQYQQFSGKDLEQAVENECEVNGLLKSLLSDEDRLHICVAAKKSAFNWPVLQTEKIKNVQVVYFGKTKEEMERAIAIDCASNPPMHVVIDSPRIVRVLVTGPENQLMAQALKN